MSITPEKIEKWKHKKKINKLIDTLSKETIKYRIFAAEALGTITDERVINPLLSSLQDNNKELKKTVIKSLGNIGDDRASEPIIQILDDKDIDIRLCAIESLGSIRDVKAVDPLIKLLNEENENLNTASAIALDRIGWKPTKDESGANYFIIKKDFKKCIEIGPHAVEPLIQVLWNGNRKIYQEAAKALGEIGEPAIEPLINALRSESGFVSGAAKIALTHMGKPAFARLIEIANDKEDIVRQLAIEILGEIGDERAIDPLVKLIHTKDDTIRFWVSESLNRLGWKPQDVNNIQYFIEKRKFDKCVEFGNIAVEPLIQCLKDENTDVRCQAAEALGKIGDTKAVSPIINLLKSEKEYKTAASALVQLGWKPTPDEIGARFYIAKGKLNKCVELGACSVEPLIEAINYEDNELRTLAVKCLGDIGDKRAMKSLIKCLEDLDTDFRCEAAKALGKMGDAGAIESLKIYLARENVFKNQEAVRALEQLGWKPASDKTSARYYVAKREFNKCIKLGDKAVEPLIQIIWHKDKNVQIAVIEALGEIRDERAIKPLVVAVKINDEDVRKAAIAALRKISEPPIEELYNMIMDEKSKTVSARLFQALSEIVDPQEVEALKIIERIYKDVYSSAPSARSTNAIIKLGDHAVKPLCKILDRRDSSVRNWAIDCLEKIGNPALYDVWRKILKNEHEDIDLRIRATYYLSEIENKESLELLFRTLENKKCEIQSSGINALINFIERKQVDTKKLLPKLSKLALNSEDGEIAEAATAAITKMESDAIIPVLKNIAESKRVVRIPEWDYDLDWDVGSWDDNLKQRRIAIEGLERIGTPKALKVLYDILRIILKNEHEDIDLRIRATYSLIGIESTASLEFLFRILENENWKIQESGIIALQDFIKQKRVDIKIVLPKLSKLALEATNFIIAERATEEIINLKSEEIIPVLKNIAKSKRDLKRPDSDSDWEKWLLFVDSNYGSKPVKDSSPWFDNVRQRQRAIEALKEMGTPAALKALQDLRV